MKVGFIRLAIRSPASRLVAVPGRLWTLAALAESALSSPAGVGGRTLRLDAIRSNWQSKFSRIIDAQDKVNVAHSGPGEVSVFNPHVSFYVHLSNRRALAIRRRMSPCRMVISLSPRWSNTAIRRENEILAPLEAA